MLWHRGPGHSSFCKERAGEPLDKFLRHGYLEPHRHETKKLSTMILNTG